jgi:hypothetical protein
MQEKHQSEKDRQVSVSLGIHAAEYRRILQGKFIMQNILHRPDLQVEEYVQILFANAYYFVCAKAIGARGQEYPFVQNDVTFEFDDDRKPVMQPGKPIQRDTPTQTVLLPQQIVGDLEYAFGSTDYALEMGHVFLEQFVQGVQIELAFPDGRIVPFPFVTTVDFSGPPSVSRKRG